MRKSILIFSLVLLALSLIDAQTASSPVRNTTAGLGVVPHPDYVSQLLDEINSINEKSERLKKQAAENGPGAQDLLRMAASLDERSKKKQVEAAQLNFQINSALYKENRKELNSFQKKISSSENRAHLTFLQKESEKSNRRAEDLYEEGLIQKDLTLKLGTLDNAQESILSAIARQQEALLKLRGSEKLASSK